MFLVYFCHWHILTEYNGKTGTGWRSLIITVVEPAGAPYTGDMNTNISNDNNTDTSNDDTNTSYDLSILTKIIITVVEFVVKQPAGASPNNTAGMNTDNH